MNERDRGYLLDMLGTADRILQRTDGLTKAVYDADEDRQIVLTHLVQIVGEAATHVSEETRAACGHIPWRQITGTRHRIVHDYINVDTDVVWEIVTTHIPQLQKWVRDILPADASDTAADDD